MPLLREILLVIVANISAGFSSFGAVSRCLARLTQSVCCPGVFGGLLLFVLLPFFFFLFKKRKLFVKVSAKGDRKSVV